jgi:hypothetical protein
MITANLRATGTAALRWAPAPSQTRAPLRTLSRPLKRVISADAASCNACRTSGLPALPMRPGTSIDIPDCHRQLAAL